MTDKNEKQITIYGEAEFIFLNQRDTAFGEPGEYKVTLKVPRAKAGVLIRNIDEVISEELKTPEPFNSPITTMTRKPYKVVGDEVHFKAHSQFMPVLWDRNQNKLDEKINVWKGSKMWANCKATGYTKAVGTGATLLLGSVQIDKLVEGQSLDTCPFPKRINGSVLPGPEQKEIC